MNSKPQCRENYLLYNSMANKKELITTHSQQPVIFLLPDFFGFFPFFQALIV